MFGELPVRREEVAGLGVYGEDHHMIYRLPIASEHRCPVLVDIDRLLQVVHTSPDHEGHLREPMLHPGVVTGVVCHLFGERLL